jgi:hypothetical protein
LGYNIAVEDSIEWLHKRAVKNCVPTKPHEGENEECKKDLPVGFEANNYPH